jgi:hypothetical protein
MGTAYKELADSVFDKIKDLDFMDMDENVAYDVVIRYIRPAIVKFENCKQDLSDRNDALEEFNFSLDDNTFELLANYMTIEWLTSNYILTYQALKGRMSTSDFHKIDTKDILGKTTELRNSLKAENDQLAINKSYPNSKLFSIVTKRK